MAPTPSRSGDPSRSSSDLVKPVHSRHWSARARRVQTAAIGAVDRRVTTTVRRFIPSSFRNIDLTVNVRGIRRAPFEAAVLGALFLAYKAVRLAVAGRVEAAFDNAHRVVSFERGLHLAIEHGLQKLVLHSTGLVVALNRYYVS